MSSIASQFDATRFTRRIHGLRSRMRRWLSVRGLARLLWIVLAILLLDMLLDRWFRMDLAQRGIMLVLIAATAAWMAWRYLVRPLSQGITDDALVLEVEKKNPQMAQSVISGFQLLRNERSGQAAVSGELATETIRQGMEQAEQVDFSGVLNRAAGRKYLVMLVTAALAFAGIAVGVAGNDFLKTWFRRNLLLSADEWPRATDLQIVGATDGKIVVPRGMDYRQLVEVTETSRVQNVDVDLEIDGASGRSLQRMKPTGRLDGREHSFMFHGIASGCRIRASGGDDTTDWVELVLVEPPAVDDLQLNALLPEWTGRTSQPLTGPGPHSILESGGMEVLAKMNKPLESATIERDGVSTPLTAGAGGENLWQVTFDRGVVTIDDKKNAKVDGGVAGGQYAIRLHDELGLTNVRDFQFEIRLRGNDAPVVRARLLGISGLAVPTARVPVEWSATDDFGIAEAKFDTRWMSESQPVGERLVPVGGFAGDRLLSEVLQTVSVLELEPLGLEPGVAFRFVLSATDFAVPAAATGSSREFLVKIVTPEELISDLLRREIEQRGVFQMAYDRQLELTSQLKQSVAAGAGPDAAAKRDLEARLLALYREQRAVGTSVVAVADRFDEFLVEVYNNRLDEQSGVTDPGQSIQGRFENDIIAPIRSMDEQLISAAAAGMDQARRVMNDPAGLNQAASETEIIQEQILEAMRVILAAMQSSENYQEAVNRLLEIRRIEQNMKRDLERPGKTDSDLPFDPLGDGK